MNAVWAEADTYESVAMEIWRSRHGYTPFQDSEGAAINAAWTAVEFAELWRKPVAEEPEDWIQALRELETPIF